MLKSITTKAQDQFLLNNESNEFELELELEAITRLFYELDSKNKRIYCSHIYRGDLDKERVTYPSTLITQENESELDLSVVCESKLNLDNYRFSVTYNLEQNWGIFRVSNDAISSTSLKQLDMDEKLLNGKINEIESKQNILVVELEKEYRFKYCL